MADEAGNEPSYRCQTMKTDLRLAVMQTALSTYYQKSKTELILSKCLP